MPRRPPAVNHCLRRAAEAEQLAALAQDDTSKLGYGQLARAWRQLARNPDFIADFGALLKALATSGAAR